MSSFTSILIQKSLKSVSQQFCTVSTFTPLKYKACWNFQQLAPQLPTHKVVFKLETANRTSKHSIQRVYVFSVFFVLLKYFKRWEQNFQIVVFKIRFNFILRCDSISSNDWLTNWLTCQNRIISSLNIEVFRLTYWEIGKLGYIGSF